MQFRVAFFSILLFCTSFQSFSSTLIVGANERFKDVRSALDIATPYDTILITSGLYLDHSLIIHHPLTLIGEQGTVIDAKNEPNELLVVLSDSVHIEGIHFKNVGTSFLKELAAIKVKRSAHGSIRNVQFSNCFFGIYLEYASHYLLKGNTISGNFTDEAKAGNAIHIWKGHHIKVIDNELQGHRDGIYFEFVDDSEIHNNKSHNNLRYGLHFMFSNRDIYTNNEFRDNGAGVAVMFSKHIEMIGNRFIQNWGGASYGLLLKEISDGEISGNTLELNTIGILAEGANRLLISRNQFTSNGTAIDMKGNCLDNVVELNNFLANTFEVVTNSSRNQNTYQANYWSQYSGYDLDRDGTGDVPYRPVNLFSKVSHEIPAATILLHSFLIDMLTAGERMFPELIPSELQDLKPRMQPYNYD